MSRFSSGESDKIPEGQQTVLERFVQACEADERVVAAFLGGSRGAGKHDEWSDLDVYVVTLDEGYEDFGTQVREFVGRLGEPLFLEDFGIQHTLFFVLADGTEGELQRTYARLAGPQPAGSVASWIKEAGRLLLRLVSWSSP